MAMTAIGVFSIVLSLAALAAFFMGGLMFTILLVREVELSETEREWPEARVRHS